MDLKEQIKKKVELQSMTEELDEYSIQLLEKRKELLSQIDEITELSIKPRKEEISQIDVAISTIMNETGVEKLLSDGYGAYNKTELSIRVIDPAKALRWALGHPQIIKKDILKSAEIKKLIKEGIVPDPQIDGVDCNDSFTKISFRKR